MASDCSSVVEDKVPTRDPVDASSSLSHSDDEVSEEFSGSYSSDASHSPRSTCSSVVSENEASPNYLLPEADEIKALKLLPFLFFKCETHFMFNIF